MHSSHIIFNLTNVAT